MNPNLGRLAPYPFQRLAQLTHDVTPASVAPIDMAIGEPKHAAPTFVLEEIKAQLAGLSVYPATKGTPALREAIAAWLTARFGLRRPPDPEQEILPCAGTREALFSIVQAVVDPRRGAPVVMMPNPFYQIYEGAALLAGAEPYFINTRRENGYRMDFDAIPAAIWRRTQLVFVCSPGNPAGNVMTKADFAKLLQLAEQYDFVIASDECYSEIYFDEAAPPIGLLRVAQELGVPDSRRCLVFHSLSKRSNLPGLRSGFIAGDRQILAPYLLYRTYFGSSLSLTVQAASIAAWRDEAHVAANRAAYREKFAAVLGILSPVLDVQKPEAGFYLWPRTAIDDERFARELLRRQNVRVLPGRYLSRPAHGIDPGENHVRLALVAPLAACIEAAERIRNFIDDLQGAA